MPVTSLQQPAEQIRSLVEVWGDGRVGVHAVNTRTGEAIGYCEDQAFPMASLVKLGIAFAVLLRVDQEKLQLNQWVRVGPEHWRAGSGLLAQFVTRKSMALPIETLLRLMLQESDNVATDVLSELVGGAETIRLSLQEVGHEAVGPHRSILELMCDLQGVPKPPARQADWWRVLRGVAPEVRAAARNSFVEDLRDCARPADMTRFIHALWGNGLLAPSSRRLLFGILSATTTGQTRIPAAALGSWVAHKTGSYTGLYAADAGLVRLKGGDHLAISVHVWAETEGSELDRRVAELARLIIAHFDAEAVTVL